MFDVGLPNEKENYIELIGKSTWSTYSSVVKSYYFVEFTNLDFEIISIVPEMELTEHAMMHKGQFSFEFKRFSEYWFGSYEELQEKLPDGVDAPKEVVDNAYCIYVLNAPWVEISNDHAFYELKYQHK